MKVLYIITYPEGSDIQTDTVTSLGSQEYIELSYKDNKREEALNDLTVPEDITHFCMIESGNLFKPQFASIYQDYLVDNTSIYLPIIEYWRHKEFKGFLNSCIWKPFFNKDNELGTVDIKLAKLGMDLTLEGALIPIAILQKYKFKGTLKFYNHLEFIARVVSKEISVKGMNKTTLIYTRDFNLENVSTEEKREDLKLVETEMLA